MVEFLVTQGADINRKDNEGWTPLHATSSCGMISIARYLIENGADLAAINSDGELPIDISGSDPMASLLQKYIDEHGIDCEEARQSEEKMMLADAKKWLRSDASEADRPHPKTGATPLHVAAAKGYTKVLNLLLAARADVDRQDNDGWTPLHAGEYQFKYLLIFYPILIWQIIPFFSLLLGTERGFKNSYFIWHGRYGNTKLFWTKSNRHCTKRYAINVRRFKENK